jgi:hypothetical protein
VRDESISASLAGQVQPNAVETGSGCPTSDNVCYVRLGPRFWPGNACFLLFGGDLRRSCRIRSLACESLACLLQAAIAEGPLLAMRMINRDAWFTTAAAGFR